LIAQRHLPRSASLLIALLYTLGPLVQGINLVNGEGFHPIAFSTTSLLYLFYFLEKGNHKVFWVFLVLALSCREDVALVGAFVGFYIMIVRQQWWRGTLVSLLCLLWFAASVGVIVPFIRGESYMVATPGLAYLGDSVSEILMNGLKRPDLVFGRVFSIQKLGYLADLLLPVLFLPLLSLRHLIPCLPQLLINLASEYYPNYIPAERYTSPIIPFLFIATICGVKHLKQLAGPVRIGFMKSRAQYLVLCFLVLAVIVSSGYTAKSAIRFVRSIVEPNNIYGQSSRAVRNSLTKLSQGIPDAWSVSFSNHRGLARFSYRKEIRALAKNSLDSDIVIIDGARPHESSTEWGEIEECESLLRLNTQFKVVFAQNGLRVYSREPLPW
jgi:uncharacterized membrane protein